MQLPIKSGLLARRSPFNLNILVECRVNMFQLATIPVISPSRAILPGPSRAVSPKCLKLSNSPTPIVRHDFPHIKLHFDPSFGVSYRIFFLRLPASQPSRTCLRKVRSSTSSDHGSLSTDGRFCTWGSVHHDDGYYC